MNEQENNLVPWQYLSLSEEHQNQEKVQKQMVYYEQVTRLKVMTAEKVTLIGSGS